MPEIKTEEISELLKKQITDFEKKVDVSEIGTVTYLGDGVAKVYGLDNCMAMEMLEFPNGVFGMALNLEEESVLHPLSKNWTRFFVRPSRAHIRGVIRSSSKKRPYRSKVSHL